MATLLLQLVGPMQSWGITSRFDERDTGAEPSKSGVVGLLAAAMGIDREDWMGIEPLTRLRMAVRHDRPGIPKRDYQTAGCAQSDTIIRADGTPAKEGVVSQRFYLADASFLVAFEAENDSLLEKVNRSLQNPVWPLALGRKSYVPSESVWIEGGLLLESLREVLFRWPWISFTRKWEERPEKLIWSWESETGSGSLRMDQPLSSFSERKFGSRFVESGYIPFPKGEVYVPA